jgi:hypothetical protein
MRFRLHPLLFLSCLATCVLAQDVADKPDIDPLALQVLRATTDSLKNAQTFSFRAVVTRERLGTNDEVLTFFRQQEITVARPDRMRVHVTGERQTADLYFNKGQAAIYSPDKKVYTQFASASPDLDRVVDSLDSKDIELPIANFFRADPYTVLIDGLSSAAVIGRVEIAGKTFHHLVFRENDAEWQLWVEAGEKPTPRRVQIVYKNLPRQPRVTVDFSDWNLNAKPPNDFFTFQKPQDAVAISFLDQKE